MVRVGRVTGGWRGEGSGWAWSTPSGYGVHRGWTGGVAAPRARLRSTPGYVGSPLRGEEPERLALGPSLHDSSLAEVVKDENVNWRVAADGQERHVAAHAELIQLQAVRGEVGLVTLQERGGDGDFGKVGVFDVFEAEVAGQGGLDFLRAQDLDREDVI